MKPHPKITHESQEAAEFWIQLGKDIGDMKCSILSMKATFDRFLDTEFKTMTDRQTAMDDKLQSALLFFNKVLADNAAKKR